MIEKQIPLEIPPGLVMNGSLMVRQGKWVDGQYVRFPNGIPTPFGAAEALTHTGVISLGGTAKAMFMWWTTDDGPVVAVGKHTKMYVVESQNGVNNYNDITPAAGLADEGDVNSWSFANVGEVLVFTQAGFPSGIQSFWSLYAYDPSVGGDAAVVDDSVYRGVFVTPESFMVLIEGLNTLKWASQATYNVLTPAVGNTAGSLDVPSPFIVVTGRPMVGESLVWTTGDLWALTYVGGSLIYGLRKVGDNCGILGANNVAITNGVARWMGKGGFFEYDGYVRPLDCPLNEYIFSDISPSHAHRFFTVAIPQHNAVQFWYFSSSAGDTADRFVEYNYANNTWTKGEGIERSAGIGEFPNSTETISGAGVPVPLMMRGDGLVLLVHEQDASGVLQNEDLGAAIAAPYLVSGPLQLDEGNRIARVQKIVPDGAAADDEISLLAGDYPGVNGSGETTFGPYVVAGSGAGPIDTRFSARYVRYLQTFGLNTSRIGIPRLGIISQGTR